MQRYLLGVGNTKDINCWSSTPYFILKGAENLSFKLEGINLNYKNLFLEKMLWNIIQFIKYQKYSGFQYSDYFINNLINKSNISINEKSTLISYFPLLPSIPFSDKWNVYYYIDATTLQIFDHYGLFKSISESHKRKVLNKEKENYKKSNTIFCMSEWAKNSLVNDYKISSKKIFVSPGGANIDIKNLSKFIKGNSVPLKPTKTNPLRIGFLGKDWERKGGPFIYDVVKYLNFKGIPTSLRVVGLKKEIIPKSKYVEFVGLINKNKEMAKFVSEIRSWHYGTLFSVAEAYGISNRECLMLGVPVICNNVGGIPSTLPDYKCGKLFNLEDDFSVVGDWIINQILNYNEYLDMRLSLSKRSYEFSWEYTLQNIFKKISLTEN